MNVKMLMDYYNAVVTHGSKLTIPEFIGLWCAGNGHNYADLSVELKWFDEEDVTNAVKVVVEPMLDGLFIVRETHLDDSTKRHLMVDDDTRLAMVVEFYRKRTDGGNHSLVLQMRGPTYVAKELLVSFKDRFEDLIKDEKLSITWAEAAPQVKEEE